MKKSNVKTILLFMSLAVGVTGVFVFRSMTNQRRIHETRIMLWHLAKSADRFQSEHGEWPERIDLVLDEAGVSSSFVDAFGHSINWTPYDPSVGYGSFLSLGRDGKRGGSGIDADIVQHFPLPKAQVGAEARDVGN